ncbi:MAG: single-stranded DNA-binding protein [Bacteroidota bacterium]|jgi:single-strand DNA-binding protein
MSLNKVMLIGNLGQDPEVKYLENNRVVANFSLATSESYTDRNGERKTDTEWHRIEMWDNLAKIAEKYLKKGQQVYIEGKIRTQTWKDKDGNEKTGIRIKAISMTMLGGSKASTSNTSSMDGAHREHVDHSPDKSVSVPDATDDLPF